MQPVPLRDLVTCGQLPLFSQCCVKTVVTRAAARLLPDINDAGPFVAGERLLGDVVVVRGPAQHEGLLRGHIERRCVPFDYADKVSESGWLAQDSGFLGVPMVRTLKGRICIDSKHFRPDITEEFGPVTRPTAEVADRRQRGELSYDIFGRN